MICRYDRVMGDHKLLWRITIHLSLLISLIRSDGKLISPSMTDSIPLTLYVLYSSPHLSLTLSSLLTKLDQEPSSKDRAEEVGIWI